MELFLKGKRAVVTGGTRGIGRAIAMSLLGSGAAVTICGRAREAAERAAAELKESTGGEVLGVAADVSQSDQAARLFETVASRFGGLDILVNNAGAGLFRPVQRMSVEDWRSTIE